MRGRVLPLVYMLAIVWLGWAGTVVAEVSPEGVQWVEMIVDSYSYKPDRLVVQAGVPVELTLKSVTWFISHNFVIKAPEAGLDINEEIPAGDEVRIRFTPARPGEYEFLCDKKLLFLKSHDERGMVGTLEVR